MKAEKRERLKKLREESSKVSEKIVKILENTDYSKLSDRFATLRVEIDEIEAEEEKLRDEKLREKSKLFSEISKLYNRTIEHRRSWSSGGFHINPYSKEGSIPIGLYTAYVDSDTDYHFTKANDVTNWSVDRFCKKIFGKWWDNKKFKSIENLKEKLNK